MELERRIEDGGLVGVEGMRAYYIEMEESPGEKGKKIKEK